MNDYESALIAHRMRQILEMPDQPAMLYVAAAQTLERVQLQEFQNEAILNDTIEAMGEFNLETGTFERSMQDVIEERKAVAALERMAAMLANTRSPMGKGGWDKESYFNRRQRDGGKKTWPNPFKPKKRG